MIHVFKSETMAGQFNACDLCNHTTTNTDKCFCQCDRTGCYLQAVTGRRWCDQHNAEFEAERTAAERAKMEALPAVLYTREMEMVYCSTHDQWGQEIDELCWDYDADAPAEGCYIHPSTKGKADAPYLHDIVSEAFYEQFGDDSYDELDPKIVTVLDRAMEVIADHAPTLYTPDMPVRLDVAVRVSSLPEEERA